MADSSDFTAKRPFANMLNAASTGGIKIKMDLDQFVHLDRDCQTFLDLIAQIQTLAANVSKVDTWGLGEHTVTDDGKKLTSGEALVRRFKTKSRGSNDQIDNSVYAMMLAHQKAVEDIQNTYRSIRKQITDHDAEQAAKYSDLEKNLPPEPGLSVTPFVPPSYPG
jgi:hypothetical protein